MNQLPLFPFDGLANSCILNDTGQLSYRQVLYRAQHLAERLPDRRYCILLCERRDLFIISFIASLMRQQTLLLPSNRTDNVLPDILTGYPDAYCLVDEGMAPLGLPGLECAWLDLLTGESDSVPSLPLGHLAAVVFTSGTTGKPEPNEKYWGDLVAGSGLLQQRLVLGQSSIIVATVPPQHMFGLETSVLAPLLAGACTYGGRPFYPEDVRQVLALADTPPTLVTTPFHLRACVEAALDWPPVQQVISATAPLDRDLAVNAERIMRTTVREIFGCSEAGSFASRISARESDWQMYQGMVIEQIGETAQISGGHLPETISLSDHLQVLNSVSFRFLGRHSDMIKIAGKRASLSELNIKLNSIPGVSDGIFVMREQQRQSVSRLLALVVAPGLEVAEIHQALADSVDPVFLPRPLLKVEALPRNDAQKLPRQALHRLLSELGYGR